MKTALSIVGSLFLLGAVTNASADDFADQRAQAHSFWDQQIACVDASDWSATYTCLSTVWDSYR
ncbi:hypothetical protein FHT03_003137 [Xanthomonas arboricola]|uniref:hypothetical protein n=1 Tax=Xanthomonas cannabis TaxID=1885674 RepID=UPI001610979B|nr:hypothetical protein [Xanthomonas cannabis]MBB3806790.1 hypothetical protein [Xanthomonas cannabis]